MRVRAPLVQAQAGERTGDGLSEHRVISILPKPAAQVTPRRVPIWQDLPGPACGVALVAVDRSRWLSPGVVGIGLASFLDDVGHEVPTSLLPTLLVATLVAPPIGYNKRELPCSEGRVTVYPKQWGEGTGNGLREHGICHYFTGTRRPPTRRCSAGGRFIATPYCWI
jgi:hypothetical protein